MIGQKYDPGQGGYGFICRLRHFAAKKAPWPPFSVYINIEKDLQAAIHGADLLKLL